MKYFYEFSGEPNRSAGEIHFCEHPLFRSCTLYRKDELGLIVIQEHYNEKTRARWWGPVAPWLAYDIYVNPNFEEYFTQNAARINDNGLYPVVTIRKIMWALRMKPLQKEIWEMEL